MSPRNPQRESDHEPTWTRNGAKGLDLARSQQFDFVFVHHHDDYYVRRPVAVAMIFAYRLTSGDMDWIGLATLIGAALFNGLASAGLALLLQALPAARSDQTTVPRSLPRERVTPSRLRKKSVSWGPGSP